MLHSCQSPVVVVVAQRQRVPHLLRQLIVLPPPTSCHLPSFVSRGTVSLRGFSCHSRSFNIYNVGSSGRWRPMQYQRYSSATLRRDSESTANTSFTPPPHQISNIAEFRRLRSQWFRSGETVGFVPTMGALHAGHMSLVKNALASCDRVVVSIFVNPAQFAPHEDLAKYPRTLDSDLELLKDITTTTTTTNKKKVDVCLVPSAAEMYPAGISLHVNEQRGAFVQVEGMSHQMEGSIRPHFFRGVATVVTKLFNIVQPTHAFFGQKDAQQCAVIKNLARDLCMPLEIVVCETQREVIDGLAMSRYLDPAKERPLASILYKSLKHGESVFKQALLQPSSTAPSSITYEQVITAARQIITKCESSAEGRGVVAYEYLTINDADTLAPLTGPINTGSSLPAPRAIFSGAVKIGKTRIIDNLLLGLNVKTW